MDPLRAIAFRDRAGLKGAPPGAVYFTDRGHGAVSHLWFLCPCGCGTFRKITVGLDHRPAHVVQSYSWNGSITEPSLRPAIRLAAQEGCKGWHGQLRGGYWEPRP